MKYNKNESVVLRNPEEHPFYNDGIQGGLWVEKVLNNEKYDYLLFDGHASFFVNESEIKRGPRFKDIDYF